MITLHPSFAVAADTRLFFESRLGWASASQFARVEVSTNNGATWAVLWSRAGTGDAGQGAFERVDISLTPYAGQIVRLRFNYFFQSGSYFPQTTLIAGWLIDDIQIGSTFEIEPVLYSISNPSPLEQEMIEMINRARADARAEATRLRETTDPQVLSAVSFFNVDFDLMEMQFAELPRHVPPVAPNARLANAARLHSLDMLENDFQGHISSNSPPPPVSPGATMSERLAVQGYQRRTASENVFAYGRSVWHGHAGFNIDWGDSGTGSVGGMQDPPGHRMNIHNPAFRELGMGLIEGSGTNVGPLLITQNFATEIGRDQPFITGVAWIDTNNNGVYDPGEGVGGVVVTVEGERFYAVTADAGGYAIPVPGDGHYTVTFSSGENPPRSKGVLVENNENVKLDYRPDLTPPMPTAPTVEYFGRATGDAGLLEFRVRTEGPVPVLQTSTDLQSWTNLPLSPATAEGSTYTFSIPVEDVLSRFFRAYLP